LKSKLEGDVNHPPSNSKGTLSSTHNLSNDRRVPSSQQVFITKTNNAAMDPKSFICLVPLYYGDAFTLYNYINCAKQWLIIAGGDKPEKVMLLLSKLEGKAAISISMIDHAETTLMLRGKDRIKTLNANLSKNFFHKK
ncbi:unnamed protein product, partial [Leptidea sinapis]